MPGGDRTGPMGYGPLTGRGAGFCAGFPVPGYMNPVPGRGFGGRGRGRGRGWRYGFYATGLPGWQRAGMGWGYPAMNPYYNPPAPQITKEQELEVLREQAESLGNALNDIEKRIQKLESQSTTE